MVLIRAWGAGIALFLFPGYALLVLLASHEDFDFVEMLCAAGGVSIVAAPLLLYAGTCAGLKFTPLALSVVLVFMAGISLWDWWRRFTAWQRAKSKKIPLNIWALLLVFILTLAARLWTVRGVDYPLWTDSYHHTVITQLIVNCGEIPSSYEPYAPINRFTYHFGFHTLSAWFHWLSRIPVPRSVVLVGQILNALAVPTGYFFIRRLFQKRSAGVVAALVLGLLSHMPAFFANWGRYPQLAGQVLLPVLMALTLDALKDQRHKRIWALLGIGIAGLFLVHIRIFLFYAVFAALAGLFRWGNMIHKGETVKGLRQPAQLVLVGVIALLFIAPWIWRFIQGYGTIVIQEVKQGYQPQRDYSYFQWQTQQLTELGMRLSWLILAGVGTLWGLFRRESGVYLIVLWILGLFLAANSYLVNITPLISNIIVIIALYLPCAVLIDYFVTDLAHLVWDLLRDCPWGRHVLRWGVGLVFLSSGAWGVISGVDLLVPENNFVYLADRQAMQWIQTHVPEDALFYISIHFWTPIVAHGLDAGYWLPLLAGRQTIMPPETYGSDGTPAYAAFVNGRARALLDTKTPADLSRVMAENGVTHVYLGYRKTCLNVAFFLNAPEYFEALYAHQGVWIFKLRALSENGG